MRLVLYKVWPQLAIYTFVHPCPVMYYCRIQNRTEVDTCRVSVFMACKKQLYRSIRDKRRMPVNKTEKPWGALKKTSLRTEIKGGILSSRVYDFFSCHVIFWRVGNMYLNGWYISVNIFLYTGYRLAFDENWWLSAKLPWK